MQKAHDFGEAEHHGAGDEPARPDRKHGRNHLSGDRDSIRKQAADTALSALSDMV